MTTQYLDNFHADLTHHVARNAAAFEAKYGKNARAFFEALPAVFQVLRRTALDMDAPAPSRRLASAAAIYLVEAHDFLTVTSAGMAGYIDDIWVAYRVFAKLADDLGDAKLEQHWRSTTLPFAEGRALAHNVDAIRQHVPSRILGLVDAFLA